MKLKPVHESARKRPAHMARENLNDLVAFVAIARERSFTRAASQLGVSQSALSHTIRALEERMGIRLLTRTTRSVVPTDAGDRLLEAVGNHLDEIEAGLAALGDLRDKPAGHFRSSGLPWRRSRRPILTSPWRS
jgi:DNA-binding transcriptional LysR family regulator